jgi:hypothetical protein
MAKAEIKKSTRSDKAWMATGVNPSTGRPFTIHGGQAEHRGKWGTQGGKTKGQVESFMARHGTPTSAVQFVNALNWQKGSQIGKTIDIPDRFFKK